MFGDIIKEPEGELPDNPMIESDAMMSRGSIIISWESLSFRGQNHD